MDTQNVGYTKRLVLLEPKWKRILDVQRPYRLHLKSLGLGFVLDIGCGLGRNLANLGGSGAGVGIDHNRHSVELAKLRGLTVFTPDEFQQSPYAREEVFDSILFSHVAEHMRRKDAVTLLEKYVVYLRRKGRLILITPQERGYRSDPTHVEYMDFTAHAAIAHEMRLALVRQYSFPFHRMLGRIFKYNEFVTICCKE